MSSAVRGVQDLPVDKTTEDTLGMGIYAQALANFIRQCDTPMVVGIQGDWGSGKTSLMKMVDSLLHDAEPDLVSVQLNTWQYAQIETPSDIAPFILMGLFRKLGDNGASGVSAAGLWDAFRRFAKIRKVGIVGLVEIEMAGSKGPSAPVDPTFEIETLKERFKDAVRQRLEKANASRAVIFIDDLDRLLPERAVEVLEVMKNFVDVHGCVFVIACDYEVVRKGLRAKFNVGEEDLQGRSFFDKIIQVPFRMPIYRYDVLQFIRKLLERMDWKFEERDLEAYQEMLEHSIGFNPRGIKRLCNTLLLLRNVIDLRPDDRMFPKDPRFLKLLFGLVCLESAYETVYAAIQKLTDRESWERVFLRPQDATGTNGDLDLESLPEEYRTHLPELLAILGRTLDVNSDGTFDEQESALLDHALRLSSITSVTERAGRARAPARSEDDLLTIVRTRGVEPLVAPIRSVFAGSPEITEGTTRSAFNFKIRPTLLGSKGGARVSIANLVVVTDESGVSFNLSWERLQALNPGSDRPDALLRLEKLLERFGARSGDSWRSARIESESDARELAEALRGLHPFGG